MDKYLFLFYDFESHLCGWECFDPKEPVSDAMAVHQAFNMLICDDLYCMVAVYQNGCHYKSSDGRLLICTIKK